MALKHQHDLVDNAAHGLLLGVDNQVGLGGVLVRVVHTGEALDLTIAGTRVDAALVRLLAVLERRGDVHQVEVTVLLHRLAGVLAGALEGGDRGGDDGGAGAGQLAGDEGDAADVPVAVLLGEAQLGRELGADGLAEQHGHGTATLLVERHLEGTGDLVLARVGVAGKEDGETLLVSGRVGLPEDLDNLGVREPLGDLTAASEP